MRTTLNCSPCSSWRTINDRRRCKSIATYCFSTGLLLRVERVGFVATSLVPLEPLPHEGEDPLDRPPVTGHLLSAAATRSPRPGLTAKSEATALSSHHVGGRAMFVDEASGHTAGQTVQCPSARAA